MFFELSSTGAIEKIRNKNGHSEMVIDNLIGRIIKKAVLEDLVT